MFCGSSAEEGIVTCSPAAANKITAARAGKTSGLRLLTSPDGSRDFNPDIHRGGMPSFRCAIGSDRKVSNNDIRCLAFEPRQALVQLRHGELQVRADLHPAIGRVAL